MAASRISDMINALLLATNDGRIQWERGTTEGVYACDVQGNQVTLSRPTGLMGVAGLGTRMVIADKNKITALDIGEGALNAYARATSTTLSATFASNPLLHQYNVSPPDAALAIPVLNALYDIVAERMRKSNPIVESIIDALK